MATGSPIGWRAYRIIDAKVVQEARGPRFLGFTDFSRNEGIKPAKREKSSAVDAGPQPSARPRQNLSREIVAARLRHRAAVCRAAAPASARTHVSGIDDGDGLDLDHEIGSGETGDADGSGLAARSQPAPGGPSLS